MIDNWKIMSNSRALSTTLKLEKHVQDNHYSDFRVSAKLDWSTKRRASRGGIYKDGPGINIAMYWGSPNTKGIVSRFQEYPSFDGDKYIGGFYFTDPFIKLDAIVAHEVAHAVQFFHYKKAGVRCKPHGPIFKAYYKEFRELLVNKHIESQQPLKADYDKYLSKFSKAVNIFLHSAESFDIV